LLGDWGFVALIIASKYLFDYHPFLLEAIVANGLGSLPLQTHLKLACNFFLHVIQACIQTIFKEKNKLFSKEHFRGFTQTIFFQHHF
jgi:hypothetical protein